MRFIDVPKLQKANIQSGSMRVTARQINLMLWTAAACLCGIAGLVLILGVMLPAKVDATAAAVSPAGDKRPVPSAQASLPPLESFESIWAKPLRRALVDAPVSAQPVLPAGSVVAAPGAVPLTLVGTIGNSLAMLQSLSGAVDVKGVGQQLAGAEITAIRPGEVDVRYNGLALTLTKPKNPPPLPGIIGVPSGQ